MNQNYHSVQFLRGVSALLVVFYHLIVIMHDRLGMAVPRFTVGMSGVDFFFAISGFIMVVVTRDHGGKATDAWNFLKRRLIRIVPLYWIATSIKLLMLLMAGQVVASQWHVVASYLFIPAWDENHHAYPILVPGWTLSFEMFFYLVFAAALLHTRNPTFPLTLLLTALAITGIVLAPFERAVLTLLSPQLLEFVAGMWVAQWVMRKRMPAPIIAWSLIAIAVLVLAFSNTIPADDVERLRVLFFGIPAVLILFAAVSLENRAVWQSPLVLALGDASYAIYFTHGFTIAAVAGAVELASLTGGIGVFVMLLASAVASCVVGILVHRHLEAPILARLKQRFCR